MTDKITKSIIVKADANTAFSVWENFENFPYFMKNIKSVTKTGEQKSRWVVEGPLGSEIRWVAETTKLEENKRIGWNTKDEEGNLTTSGQVTFNQLPENQTEVTVMTSTIQMEAWSETLLPRSSAILKNASKKIWKTTNNMWKG